MKVTVRKSAINFSSTP